MSDLSIREAWFDDIAALREIGRASRQVAYVEAGLIPEDENSLELERLWGDRMLKGLLASLNIKSYIAEQNNVGVGMLAGRTKVSDDGTVRLFRLYVHPDYWGQSVGKRLWSKYWEVVPFEAKAIELSVLRDNEQAKRFYERLGFESVEDKSVETDFGTRHITEMRLNLVKAD